VTFIFYPRSLEGSEDFWLQVNDGDADSWVNVAEWAHGLDFNNGAFYHKEVEMMELRFKLVLFSVLSHKLVLFVFQSLRRPDKSLHSFVCLKQMTHFFGTSPASVTLVANENQSCLQIPLQWK
jgi:hypothetical protein